jgi:hypothetical protein
MVAKLDVLATVLLALRVLPVVARLSLVPPTHSTPTMILSMVAKLGVPRWSAVIALHALRTMPVGALLSLVPPVNLIPMVMLWMGVKQGVLR